LARFARRVGASHGRVGAFYFASAACWRSFGPIQRLGLRVLFKRSLPCNRPFRTLSL
jgi:hypothetical protein